jgi:hypothetical protein
VVFAKRRSRRTPLQRLSDQRRSLALGGLAIGAVVSAAAFRRRRRGEEVQLESAPETDDVPQPINAASATERVDAVKPAPAPSTVEPATGELSTEEARVLAVLAQSGRADDDRTAIAVAASLERDAGDVADVLRKLGAEGVVSGELRTASGEEIWAVTERGVGRLGAQS